jgi:hypothetical protein
MFDREGYDLRFLDLAEVCCTLPELMMLWGFVPYIECPICFEGFIPDPDSEPVAVQWGDVIILSTTPKVCPNCFGKGAIPLCCPN